MEHLYEMIMFLLHLQVLEMKKMIFKNYIFVKPTFIIEAFTVAILNY